MKNNKKGLISFFVCVTVFSAVVVNLNVGHASPRCIVPFGVHAQVSVERQEITFGR